LSLLRGFSASHRRRSSRMSRAATSVGTRNMEVGRFSCSRCRPTGVKRACIDRLRAVVSCPWTPARGATSRYPTSRSLQARVDPIRSGAYDFVIGSRARKTRAGQRDRASAARGAACGVVDQTPRALLHSMAPNLLYANARSGSRGR
jgi:hypothetical protein